MMQVKIEQLLNNFCAKNNITLTPLRKEILFILYGHNGPLGAYEILEKLKENRPNAEPPTVYRVLDFLLEVHLIHRIESQNTYVCCAHIAHEVIHHQAILIFCKKCQKSFEYDDNELFFSIKRFSQKHHVEIDSTLIEMKGLCTECLNS